MNKLKKRGWRVISGKKGIGFQYLVTIMGVLIVVGVMAIITMNGVRVARSGGTSATNWLFDLLNINPLTPIKSIGLTSITSNEATVTLKINSNYQYPFIIATSKDCATNDKIPNYNSGSSSTCTEYNPSKDRKSNSNDELKVTLPLDSPGGAFNELKLYIWADQGKNQKNLVDTRKYVIVNKNEFGGKSAAALLSQMELGGTNDNTAAIEAAYAFIYMCRLSDYYPYDNLNVWANNNVDQRYSNCGPQFNPTVSPKDKTVTLSDAVVGVLKCKSDNICNPDLFDIAAEKMFCATHNANIVVHSDYSNVDCGLYSLSNKNPACTSAINKPFVTKKRDIVCTGGVPPGAQTFDGGNIIAFREGQGLSGTESPAPLTPADLNNIVSFKAYYEGPTPDKSKTQFKFQSLDLKPYQADINYYITSPDNNNGQEKRMSVNYKVDNTYSGKDTFVSYNLSNLQYFDSFNIKANDFTGSNILNKHYYYFDFGSLYNKMKGAGSVDEVKKSLGKDYLHSFFSMSFQDQSTMLRILNDQCSGGKSIDDTSTHIGKLYYDAIKKGQGKITGVGFNPWEISELQNDFAAVILEFRNNNMCNIQQGGSVAYAGKIEGTNIPGYMLFEVHS